MMRIVSLLAGSTEIICALGFGDRLVKSFEILAELMDPDTFPPKHPGMGWKQYF